MQPWNYTNLAQYSDIRCQHFALAGQACSWYLLHIALMCNSHRKSMSWTAQ
jgi:hypothetical protein